MKPGTPCTLNTDADLWFEADARPFIGAACEVVKVCKSGLIQVRLMSDPRQVYSAPKRNVDDRS
jgi:hypothetical protein